MNRRDFFKSLAVLPAMPVLVHANQESAAKQEVVKMPCPIDWMVETFKEKEIPGYVQKKVAWIDLNLETGEWEPCGDDDPIYQHNLVNEWWS
jgi:hypothetical protein